MSEFTILEKLPETAQKTIKAISDDTVKALEALKVGKVLRFPAEKKDAASAIRRACNRELYGALAEFKTGRQIVERYIDKADKAILLKTRELTRTDWDGIIKNREAAKTQAKKKSR